MEKMVIVFVECKVKYFMYGKVMVCFKKYYVYNEGNFVKVGDLVEIVEICLVFCIKFWVVISVL